MFESLDYTVFLKSILSLPLQKGRNMWLTKQRLLKSGENMFQMQNITLFSISPEHFPESKYMALRV